MRPEAAARLLHQRKPGTEFLSLLSIFSTNVHVQAGKQDLIFVVNPVGSDLTTGANAKDSVLEATGRVHGRDVGALRGGVRVSQRHRAVPGGNLGVAGGRRRRGADLRLPHRRTVRQDQTGRQARIPSLAASVADQDLIGDLFLIWT